MIKFYREVMGGVDRADQMSGLYELDRKSTKWWKKIFYRLLMMSLVNSWVIYSQLGRKQTPFIDYLINVAENLIEEGKKTSKNQRRNRYGRKNGPTSTHLPVKGTLRRRCASCSQKRKEKRTKIICQECQIPLCLECFAGHHK